MSNVLNKVLNFVGWETDEEFQEEITAEKEDVKEETPIQSNNYLRKSASSNKVVNLHSGSQMKVVVVQPGSFNDAQEICDHLKNKKTVVVNLEEVEKDIAQRIIDFIGGAIYALDGSIQRVSSDIFIIAPNNVDVIGEFKDVLKNKGAFPWMK